MLTARPPWLPSLAPAPRGGQASFGAGAALDGGPPGLLGSSPARWPPSCRPTSEGDLRPLGPADQATSAADGVNGVWMWRGPLDLDRRRCRHRPHPWPDASAQHMPVIEPTLDDRSVSRAALYLGADQARRGGSVPESDPTGPRDPDEEGRHRRGLKFRKRDDHAVELFREALGKLEDVRRVDRILLELGRFYNPYIDEPIV